MNMMSGTFCTFRLQTRRARSDTPHHDGFATGLFVYKATSEFTARTRKQAFSRVDLMVMVAVLILLGAWFGFTHSGERGRIVQCTHNLKVLGEAMFSYANDHGDSLPPAVIEEPLTTWDIQLLPYLPQAGQSQLTAAKSPGAKKQLEWSGSKKRSNWFKRSNETLLVCPSDPAMSPNVRSYAMPAHDLADWPPGSNSWSGIGLVWTKANLAQVPGMSTNPVLGKDQLEALGTVKLSEIPDPANTLLLTELINPHNIIGALGRSWVMNASQQQADSNADPVHFHFGRFNYLMVDGHVELLSGLQTGGMGNPQGGIWTIREGD